MAHKLIGNGDCIVLRNTTARGVYIPPVETKEVVYLVGEVAYVLYSIFRTAPFKEAVDFNDNALAELIGWPAKKVQKYRLILEAEELLHSIRYGSKTDGITKLFVGAEQVALFNAGLPADILNPKAMMKLKRKFNIKSTKDLITNVSKLVKEFEVNPQEYT